MYHETAQQRKAIGDAAADGVIGGLVAGTLMAIYLVASGWLTGQSPAAILGLFSPGGDDALTGTLLHLGMSSAYGALFGVGWSLIARRRQFYSSWLAGLGYGMVLFIVAAGILLPVSNAPLRAIPAVHFWLAHAIYGVLLGMLIGRGR